MRRTAIANRVTLSADLPPTMCRFPRAYGATQRGTNDRPGTRLASHWSAIDNRSQRARALDTYQYAHNAYLASHTLDRANRRAWAHRNPATIPQASMVRAMAGLSEPYL